MDKTEDAIPRLNAALAESHKTISQLRDELAQANTQLSAWHEQFGTTQLDHAAAAYEQAKAKVARLEAALATLEKYSIEPIYNHSLQHGTPGMAVGFTCTHCKASCKRDDTLIHDTQCPWGKDLRSTALSDLLKPTVELLTMARDLAQDLVETYKDNIPHVVWLAATIAHKQYEAELARLKAPTK